MFILASRCKLRDVHLMLQVLHQIAAAASAHAARASQAKSTMSANFAVIPVTVPRHAVVTVMLSLCGNMGLCASCRQHASCMGKCIRLPAAAVPEHQPHCADGSHPRYVEQLGGVPSSAGADLLAPSTCLLVCVKPTVLPLSACITVLAEGMMYVSALQVKLRWRQEIVGPFGATAMHAYCFA